MKHFDANCYTVFDAPCQRVAARLAMLFIFDNSQACSDAAPLNRELTCEVGTCQSRLSMQQLGRRMQEVAKSLAEGGQCIAVRVQPIEYYREMTTG